MALDSKKYQRKGISLRLISWIISIFVMVISTTLIVSLGLVYHQNKVVNEISANCITLEKYANDVQSASDYLTAEVRLFVVNADKKYMDAYFEEANVTKRRETALEEIHRLSENTSKHEEIHSNISAAIAESKDLMNLEFYAMKLICVKESISFAEYPEVANANIEGVAPADYKNAAIEAVLGSEYARSKEKISYHINLGLQIIDNLMGENQKEAERNLHSLIVFQSVVIGVNIAFAFAVIVVLFFQIIKPINETLESIEKNEEVTAFGTREFNYLVDTYNEAHSQNETVKEKLRYEAEHDKLTNLYNRTGYASLYRIMRLSKTLYVLLDVDKFKEINDKYGHDMGDRVLIKLAKTLDTEFMEGNISIFRIGGDEFAILINDIDKDQCQPIIERLEKINDVLAVPQGKIPAFSISVGIAHGDEEDTTDTLFKKADNALYKVKQSGKSGVNYDK